MNFAGKRVQNQRIRRRMDFRGTGILDKNFDLDGLEEEREKKMEDRNEAPIYNNIYRARVCVCALLLRCEQRAQRDSLALTERNPKHSPLKGKNHRVKAAERDTKKARAATARACYENDLTKRRAELRAAFT
jgi:hypothetical protein